ncbi:copper amine oxidase N-terminal domain-containing protein [Lysinibacillus xylanilyticus]|uniref:Copper amine oxidase N-terminal domain-containing protein n=1 Tax=Lysinibacillus xylanilyticus TaxID=582475 RepID=A0ABT4EUD4_9BACI|nr:copper amine oxidase N-terminal domain-containing protein [Lysinibacillus xylanilyticus]MCY9547876.1 copper amine oxidase N-terminal domain-containing protein [Lysinibacillus xylanilyticus]
MKKIWTMLLAAILIVPLVLQPVTAQAARAITIYVDGVQLKTDQPPAMVQGRVMLPLRAIFEALDASVDWDRKKQTVTATKGDTTVVLKIKSRVATINNKTVTLDVPAQILGGRTMVPVRFVSEALGQDVDWNSRSQVVTINSDNPSNPDTPSNISISPASYVSGRDVSNQGDGRDLEVSFSKSSTESLVDHYRVLVVKASKSFNQASALKVSASNYTKVSTTGSNRSITLSQSSRDVDGDYIKNDQPYVVYVLAVGKSSYSSVLSNSSPKITLSNMSSVPEVTNVKINDISDFGDGRDISVSFTRPQNDNNISNYRVFIVKTKDANNFSLTTANNLSSSYYTTVNKSGSNGGTLSGTLTSSSRDSSGDYIKNGVSYTAFVLSVSNNNSADNKLSSASSSVTLSPNTVATPVITQIDDVNDYGDGRDLRVSFNKISNESNISSYRIFVVKASNYSNFTLTKANSLSSSYYTQVNKTGYNITQVLSSGARDTDGYAIQNGVSYRVFVMAVGTNSGNNVLSSASNAITLYSSNVGAVSNLYASDVNDYGNGRDLYVSFTKAADESNISNYRIMVVPTAYYSSFSLSDANNVSSSNYTTVNKLGNNTYGQALSENARDVRGNYIKEGNSYRVYVLSVGYGNYSGSNALSAPTSTVTLGKNYNVQAVTSLTTADVNDYGDGRDLQVSFTKPSDETNVNHYRIFVVPTAYSSSFNLSQANSSSYYITESRGGNKSVTRTLDSTTRDVRGNLITEGTNYRVYVLTVANGNSSSVNALASDPSTITLTKNKAVQAVSNVNASDVNDFGDGRDLQVSFTKPSDEANVNHYRIFVVPTAYSSSFNLSQANSSSYYITESRGGNKSVTRTLDSTTRDVRGNLITEGTNYRVYVLTVAIGNSSSVNALASASLDIMLAKNKAVQAVSNVNASDVNDSGDGRDLQVSFNHASDESNISEYRIIVVPKNSKSFNASTVSNTTNYTAVSTSGSSTNQVLNATAKDIDGNFITNDTPYNVYVLSVGKDSSTGKFTLSGASNEIKLINSGAVEAVTNVNLSTTGNTGTYEDIRISFDKVSNEKNVTEYRVFLIPSNKVENFKLSDANKVNPQNYNSFNVSDNTKGASIKIFDINGMNIEPKITYQAVVMTVTNSGNENLNILSVPSNQIVLQTKQNDTPTEQVKPVSSDTQS